MRAEWWAQATAIGQLRWLSLAASLGLVSVSWGEVPVWTVDDAVARALEVPHFNARLAAELNADRARFDEDSVTPLPQLGLAHEQVFGDVNVAYRETSALVQQTFDVAGGRPALRDALTHREVALRAGVAQGREEARGLARHRFYRVVYEQSRAQTMEAWLSALANGVTASPRDETRRLSAMAQVAAQVRRTNAAWTALHQVAPFAARPRLDADLAAVAAAGRALAGFGPPQADDLPPGVARLRALSQAVAAERRAFGRPWLRDWTVGLGYRLAETAGYTGHGVLVGLTVPIALWNVDEARLARLAAEARLLDDEARLEAEQARRGATAAQTALGEARRALAALPPEADPAVLEEALIAVHKGAAVVDRDATAWADAAARAETLVALSLARWDLLWAVVEASLALE